MDSDDLRACDWQGRCYDYEIAFVRFLSGFVLWVDDEPFNEGEPFPTRKAALKALHSHMGELPTASSFRPS